jgi:hypothetical protein
MNAPTFNEQSACSLGNYRLDGATITDAMTAMFL